MRVYVCQSIHSNSNIAAIKRVFMPLINNKRLLVFVVPLESMTIFELPHAQAEFSHPVVNNLSRSIPPLLVHVSYICLNLCY